MAMDVAGQYPSMPLWEAPVRHEQRKWRARDRPYGRYSKNVRVRGQGQGYDPPRLEDLREENRLRTSRFYGKTREPRSVPRAPYNDSSFLMYVRRSGGLASPSSSSVFESPTCVSACGSPVLVRNDYGYGSMTGLIHLRPTDDGDRSSGGTILDDSSDDTCVEQQPSVDSAQQLERRLDRDVSRFEMGPLPWRASEDLMEQRVARQDTHIAYLEDENLVLKERLFLVQQEVGELRQRLQGGERCSVYESDEHDDIDDTQSYYGR